MTSALANAILGTGATSNAVQGSGSTQNAVSGTGTTQNAVNNTGPVQNLTTATQGQMQEHVKSLAARQAAIYQNPELVGTAQGQEMIRALGQQINAANDVYISGNTTNMADVINQQTAWLAQAADATTAGLQPPPPPQISKNSDGTFSVLPSVTGGITGDSIDPTTGKPYSQGTTGSGGVLGAGTPPNGITGNFGSTLSGNGSTSGGGSSGGGGGGGSPATGGSGSGSSLVDDTRAFNNAASAGGGGVPIQAPSVYGPTASGYSSAMVAATNAINAGMGQVANTVNSGIASNNQAVSNAVNSINSLYGLGYSTSNNTYDQAVAKYEPIASGAAGDYQYLKNMTQGGFDQNFADYQNSGAYRYGLNEGIDSVRQSGAARGLLNSGATLKAVSRYAQGYQNSQYLNYQQQQLNAANQLANYSGSALNSQTSLLGQKAQNQGGLLSNQANAVGNAALSGVGYNTALNSSLAQAYGQSASSIANIKAQGMLGASSTNIPIGG